MAVVSCSGWRGGSPMTPMIGQSSTLEGLPKQFVSALRTLFDILDDKGTGFVLFSDIEYRWQDDGTKGLPKGVIESLRKVTPPNGLLSFERFCAGLKICLLRNQMEVSRGGGCVEARPPSAPLLDLDTGGGGGVGAGGPGGGGWGMGGGRALGPASRALSLPQLAQPQGRPYGPPKPPRLGLPQSPPQGPPWPHALPLPLPQDIPPHKKTAASRRREPRRHTLQNGIDYNMMKRMKQFEVEKEVLAQGLEAVERARDWYLKQLSSLQEKMGQVSRTGHAEPWSEAQEERVELQRARILEINRQLGALTEGGGVPLHMNLAVLTPQLVVRLRQENLLLNQEVSKKGDRIATLEREKASLIRELLSSRVHMPS